MRLLVLVLLILSAFCAYAQEIDPELLKRAEAGDAEAQTDVAVTFVNTENYSKAFEWFSKAADQGFARAQNGIGVMYYDGKGVTQDRKTAFEWYFKAANQGYVSAQTNIGLMYAKGDNVTQDYGKAFAWFQKAANQGDAYGQENLGLMYSLGQGVPKNEVTGCAWIYLSQDAETSAICDSRLTPNQMTRTLHMVDELKQNFKQ